MLPSAQHYIDDFPSIATQSQKGRGDFLSPRQVEVAAGLFEEAVIDNLGDGEWLGDF
jgi:hypothetical protein